MAACDWRAVTSCLEVKAAGGEGAPAAAPMPFAKGREDLCAGGEQLGKGWKAVQKHVPMCAQL
jgi:hypothetical protein